MLRKVLIVLGILAAILLMARWGIFLYTKQFSPAAVAEFHANGLDASVEYSQPSKKGRLIFGTEAQQALVPYGRVWRTGANEATLLNIKQDVFIAGKLLKAGKYTLWSIPNPHQWTLIVNGEIGQWGTEYDPKRDVLRVEVPATSAPDSTEHFTISFEQSSEGADLLLSWDTLRVRAPLTLRH